MRFTLEELAAIITSLKFTVMASDKLDLTLDDHEPYQSALQKVGAEVVRVESYLIASISLHFLRFSLEHCYLWS